VRNLGQANVHGLNIKTLLKALKACGYIMLALLLPVLAEAKEITMPYEDFLQVISIKEHSEKLKNRAMAENGVLLKLNNEHKTIIKIQADQIQACEKIVQQQEQLGATEEQISKVVQAQLLQKMQELAQEKRLSRYKSEAFWLGVIAVGLWVVN
jgi:hypothetical protein